MISTPRHTNLRAPVFSTLSWRGKDVGRAPDAFFPYEDPGQAAARQLSDEAFQRAWAEGQAMSLEEALAYAREDA
jgi:hypothetical protein